MEALPFEQERRVALGKKGRFNAKRSTHIAIDLGTNEWFDIVVAVRGDDYACRHTCVSLFPPVLSKLP